MNLGLIASIAYSINVAYCAAIGDEQVSWNNAPENIKKGIEAGVAFQVNHPDATPEQSHEEWLKDKEANGWVYGEEKDVANKTHPNILPYAELPPEQHAKDYIFKAVVSLLKDLPDPEDHLELSNKLIHLQKQILDNGKTTTVLTKKQVVGVGVSYIHKTRERFKDNLYGTGLTFERGLTIVLPEEIAQKFLSHPEFVRVDANGDNSEQSLVESTLDESIQKKQLEDRLKEDQVFDEIEAIKAMRTKDAVRNYIKSRYGDETADNLKLAELQAMAIEKVHGFGVV